MGILESDIQSHLHQLSCQLDQLRITHRDSSLKFKREQQVLKRVVTSLSAAYQGSNSPLSRYLLDVQHELEHQKDVSLLIPRLAVLERMLKQHAQAETKQNHCINEQVKNSGATLQRVSGLPAQLKRELRNVMNVSEQNAGKNVDQATKLLNIYERALKIIATNSTLHHAEAINGPDKSQLELLASDLQHTITELDFEGPLGEQLLEIRAKVLLGVGAESLIDLTLTALKLVVEATKAERKASTQFLTQLNTSLSSNLKTAHQNLDQHQSYFEHRQELNAEMSDLLCLSQQSLSQAKDIDELKQDVAPLLAQMMALSERIKMSEEREQTLQERLSHNKNQLETVFAATQEYRRRLDDQTQRMLLDPLTKVYNRAAFIERMELEYHRWIRSQHNLRVVLFDIDSFKAINDSYGFAAGDKALKIIARTMSKRVEKTDTIARFSGEKFILLIPKQSDEYTLELVKSMQKEIANLPFKFRDENITITLTAVSTAFKEADTPEYLLDRLNIMHRNTKQSGANQIDWN